MDGFKNTTKTSYDTASGRKFANGGMTVSRNDMPGGQGPMNKPAMVAKYAKGGSVKKADQKIGRVMTEFTEGKLHSGSKDGPKVKSTKQAVAIALNEARAAGAKIPRVKKNLGGAITDSELKALRSAEADDVLMARMSKDELAMGSKGLKMARERMARDRNKGMGAITDSDMRLLQREIVKPARKGVPVASDKPLISSRMQEVGKSIGVKKAMGGLSVMPKGGKC